MAPEIVLTFGGFLLNSVLVFIAILGVWKWRDELKYREKFRVARDLALLARKFQANFNAARNPLTYKNEYQDRPQDEKQPSILATSADEKYAREKRLEPLSPIITEMINLTWEADIILNQNYNEYVDSYFKLARKLGFAVQKIFDEEFNKWVLSGRISQEKYEELHNIVYASEDDEIKQEVEKITNDFTSDLKRHLK